MLYLHRRKQTVQSAMGINSTSVVLVCAELLVHYLYFHRGSSGNSLMETLYQHVNAIAAFSVLLAAALVLKDRRAIRGGYVDFAFLVCVLVLSLIHI